MKEVSFRGIKLHAGSYEDALEYILNMVLSGMTGKIITHINLRNYFYLMRDDGLKEALGNNSTMFFEGIGMKTGFFLRGRGIVPDVNGTDLFPVLMKSLSGCPYRIYLLGSVLQAAEGIADKIRKEYPSVNIAGIHSGYFDEKTEEEIVNDVNNKNTDILIAAMGFPLQEKFALRNLNRLNVKAVWCTGGLFDFISGMKKRAPGFVRALRLEWLYRFLKEPKRMLHRNTIAAFWSLFDIIFKR
ncbi:MAG TPA: WecB/TagA/CpsF family glycosyltransferase [Ignavibacteria bacterium]|nr:WecB/TagA/CpsF family glycosyltransferase [Ignavibacteria bacterium]